MEGAGCPIIFLVQIKFEFDSIDDLLFVDQIFT